MDAHIAELIGSDGASMYNDPSFGGSTSIQGPSGSFSLGGVSTNSGALGLAVAVIILVVFYAKTRSIQK